jgi:predicted RND superfamily exporter protein
MPDLKSTPPPKSIANGLVQNSKMLMGCLILVTLMLSVLAFQVRIDTAGVSFNTADSQRYKEYLAFVDSFGTDDYILLAVKNTLAVSDPEFKQRMERVNQELSRMDSILKVIDLGTIASSDFLELTGIQSKGPPFKGSQFDGTHFWDDRTLRRFFHIIPGLSRLISNDRKTIAFIVKINNEQINGFQLENRLNRMKKVIVAAFPEHPHCYAAGIPVLRAAFERYNLLNALVFGALGLLFGTLIAFYIFKTLWAGGMVLLASLGSLIWTLGIMGTVGISLNLATGLSFGFILVVSTTTVFHITSAYFQRLKSDSKQIALTRTFETILRPCFMCALTTSAGFLSLTISPVAMVHQAGIIISIGVMTSFLLTVLITSFCLPKVFISKGRPSERRKVDFLGKFVTSYYMMIGFKKPGLSVFLGMVFLIVMLAGIPRIKPVKHLSSPMIKSTQEALDLSFIEQHISTGYSFSVVLHDRGSSFDSRKFWYDLYQFEKKIKGIPGVDGVESLTPLVFLLARTLSPMGVMPELVFRQIQSKSLVQSKTFDNELIRSYFDPGLKKLRIIVHIQNHSSDEIETILKQVEIESNTFAQQAGISLVGQLILLKSQTTALVSSQLKTLFLAFFIITVLMICQLNSFLMGMLSLIPNLFPLVTIFGIMGWFNIPLDPLTIFAAVLSFGFSVDDSIHYLTQLKRETIHLTKGSNLENCLIRAYHRTSRALVSTTAVLFLSSLGLLFSSFQHVFSLGVLIACASIVALMGDLIFMPGLILTFKPLYRVLSRKMNNKNESNHDASV